MMADQTPPLPAVSSERFAEVFAAARDQVGRVMVGQR
jgi:hypothetical protein